MPFVAGTDEVGRGAFAGPVVTAIVAFTSSDDQVREDIANIGIKITDSKKLTQKSRESANLWIKNNACFATGEAWVTDINQVGIVSATNIAYRQALRTFRKKYNVKLDKLFTDAFYIPYLPSVPKHKQEPVVKGDIKILQISAASIIAKVYRDSIMCALHDEERNAKYLWHKNKGYGTLAHRNAIVKFGVCRYHRRDFVRSTINSSSSSQAQSGA